MATKQEGAVQSWGTNIHVKKAHLEMHKSYPCMANVQRKNGDRIRTASTTDKRPRRVETKSRECRASGIVESSNKNMRNQETVVPILHVAK